MADLDLDAEKNIKELNNEFWKATGNPYIPAVTHHVEFLGPTQSGKTRILKQLLDTFWIDLYDEIFVFSPNGKRDGWAALGVPDKNIILDVSQDSLIRVLRQAESKFDHSPEKGENNWMTLIILDDIAMDLKKYNHLPNIVSKCRHVGTTIMYTIQDAKYILPAVRLNMTCTVISPRFQSKSAIERITLCRNMEAFRNAHTPDSQITLSEAIAECRLLNDERGTPHGKILVSSVCEGEPKFFYVFNGEMIPMTGRCIKLKVPAKRGRKPKQASPIESKATPEETADADESNPQESHEQEPES